MNAENRATGGSPALCRSVADVAERLMEKYEGRLSLATVTSIVRATARAFGQSTLPASVPDTIHDLADRRLSSTAATCT